MSRGIAKLISTSYSNKEASAYLAYTISDRDLQALAEIGREILSHVPFAPGACAHLSALWVALARERSALPVYQVAGRFSIGGRCIFGSEKKDFSAALSNSTFDWDGHCWTSVGGYIGDISIFRTTYSPKAPVLLREATLKHFGPGRGLLLAKQEDLTYLGFDYEPLHVLTASQIEALSQSASNFFAGRK